MKTTGRLKEIKKEIKKVKLVSTGVQVAAASIAGVGVTIIEKLYASRTLDLNGLESIVWVQDRLNTLLLTRVFADVMLVGIAIIYIQRIHDASNRKVERLYNEAEFLIQ